MKGTEYKTKAKRTAEKQKIWLQRTKYTQTKSDFNQKIELNEWEIQVVRDKLPRQAILRRNILLGLDVAFNFNRTKLARFLQEQGLIGYSRTHLYKILGNPVLRSQECEVMNEVLSRIGQPDLLPLIVQRSTYKAISDASLGGAVSIRFEK